MRNLNGFLKVVVPPRIVSNFLPEDYDTVLKFMNAELQKKKRKL